MHIKPRLLTLAVSAAISQMPQAALAEDVDFDVKTMEARGLSGQVAEYFKSEKRFAPGRGTVTLVVNGVQAGAAEVVFDSEGQPCYDQAFFARAGLKAPCRCRPGHCSVAPARRG
ncbi:FimD/PapC N-terminal domain-containing protein [Cupriavidus necator]|uniref:FimD/PapC N-terminal domain-containing protein n=1 Tax=Cupriavidus necator TaxID=106590 RepID=UPI0005B4E337|nr:FimD/PapC N-terminal domain-containing protein [Cupriavidus necator]